MTSAEIKRYPSIQYPFKKSNPKALSITRELPRSPDRRLPRWPPPTYSIYRRHIPNGNNVGHGARLLVVILLGRRSLGSTRRGSELGTVVPDKLAARRPRSHNHTCPSYRSWQLPSSSMGAANLGNHRGRDVSPAILSEDGPASDLMVA